MASIASAAAGVRITIGRKGVLLGWSGCTPASFSGRMQAENPQDLAYEVPKTELEPTAAE